MRSRPVLVYSKKWTWEIGENMGTIIRRAPLAFLRLMSRMQLARFGPSQQITQHAAVPTQIPFPGCEALTVAAERYAAALPGADYYGDLIRAHRAAGLMHEHALGDKRCATFGTGQHQKAKKHL